MPGERKDVIQIDGSYGEGGGQILRTSLALSCVSGKAVEIDNIRRARPKPGLQPQHLTAVKAAAGICNASVQGAEISSTAIRFVPGRVTGKDYSFDVSETKGSAGSTSLVLQTILLPLLLCDRPSTITLTGGTHVPWSPTYHYLADVFLPALSKMDLQIQPAIYDWGWYPLGGGRLIVKIQPREEFPGLTIVERGSLKKVSGISAVSNLPADIAERQRNRSIRVLQEKGIDADIEIKSAPSGGKGTLLHLLAEFENVSAGFDSLGALRKRAETVADEACKALFEYLDTGKPIDPHLADQLVPYLALAHGNSEIATSRITRHLLTNIWVVKFFVHADIRVDGREGEAGSIMVHV